MYQPGKVLTEIARKRLTAIREFTEFGAGFKLAMRDLELRGAGNMLGEAQSGHIESIGYELYCKEIDRAVRRLKGETVTDQRSEITIDIPVAASVPASYIEDETLRLQAYKKIASINCKDDADDVADELTDRYGDVPEEAISLIKAAEIRAHAEYTGAASITQKEKFIQIRFSDNVKLHPFVLVMARSEFGDELQISEVRGLMLQLRTGRTVDIDKLLSLMRCLRAAKQDAAGMEAASSQ
jgi:transcription-repair coupling factor (superfamily II helicase)